ncbi:hypothetical protein [Agaribacterium sp. ZY112]|uniref:hypothetical protein n=1 Tax=Agaribacterium sp. ZY112 TaxID=3233574 RepID=UPI0035236452
MARLLVVTLLFFGISAIAETGEVKGVVEYVRIHDGEVHPSWSPPVFWFTLKGVAEVGECGTWKGRALFAMDSSEAYSMALSAHMAGKEIGVHYDDSKRAAASHYCKATYITVGSPVL